MNLFHIHLFRKQRSQLFLTWSREIKFFEPSEGIFRDPTKYWTTKKICKIENLRPLLNTNIPLISEKYGLRNHF